jgi:hypothetical protein
MSGRRSLVRGMRVQSICPARPHRSSVSTSAGETGEGPNDCVAGIDKAGVTPPLSPSPVWATADTSITTQTLETLRTLMVNTHMHYGDSEAWLGGICALFASRQLRDGLARGLVRPGHLTRRRPRISTTAPLPPLVAACSQASPRRRTWRPVDSSMPRRVKIAPTAAVLRMSSKGCGWTATPGPSPPPLPGVSNKHPTSWAPSAGAYSTADTAPCAASMVMRWPCRLAGFPALPAAAPGAHPSLPRLRRPRAQLVRRELVGCGSAHGTIRRGRSAP